MAEHGLVAIERAAFMAGYRAAHADDMPWEGLADEHDEATEDGAEQAWVQHTRVPGWLAPLYSSADDLVETLRRAGGLAGVTFPG